MDQLAHFQILEKLAEGGMGVIFKARDTHLDRFVAVKVLPPRKGADDSRRQRFINEAKAASALDHPNIITVHDVTSDGGVDFMVMELVQGRTLDQLIPRDGLPLPEVLKYAIQAADGMAAAHAAGIIHRDLKPENLMVTESGLVKVLDFGAAKLQESDDVSESEAVAPLGTRGYMSPEQAEGRPVDSRSDVFSFGALLYEMVTGRSAFRGDSQASTLSAVRHDEPPPPRELIEDLPPEMERIILRCLRKDPAGRFQTMADLKAALEELED